MERRGYSFEPGGPVTNKANRLLRNWLNAGYPQELAQRVSSNLPQLQNPEGEELNIVFMNESSAKKAVAIGVSISLVGFLGVVVGDVTPGHLNPIFFAEAIATFGGLLPASIGAADLSGRRSQQQRISLQNRGTI